MMPIHAACCDRVPTSFCGALSRDQGPNPAANGSISGAAHLVSMGRLRFGKINASGAVLIPVACAAAAPRLGQHDRAVEAAFESGSVLSSPEGVSTTRQANAAFRDQATALRSGLTQALRGGSAAAVAVVVWRRLHQEQPRAHWCSISPLALVPDRVMT